MGALRSAGLDDPEIPTECHDGHRQTEGYAMKFAPVVAVSPGAKVETGTDVDVLRCCASGTLPTENVERLGVVLRSEIDWTALIHAAERHGMTPLLFWHVSRSFPERIPKETMTELRNRFFFNSRRNLYLTRELLDLLGVLLSQGVTAVPYKGPVLAASIYGNLALRRCGDIDILVSLNDISRARDLLMARGYRLELEGYSETTNRFFGYNHVFVRDDITVEVHWAIAPRWFGTSIDLGSMLGRRQQLSLVGITVSALTPDDLLLVLCVHGARHCWERLIWVADIAEIIRANPGIAWAALLATAAMAGSERMVLLGVFLAYHLLSAPLPAPVRRKLEEDSCVQALAVHAMRNLVWGASKPVADEDRHQYCLLLRERMWDRFHYCCRRPVIPKGAARQQLSFPLRWLLYPGIILSPNHRDWDCITLPRSLHFLYTLVRPIRLAAKAGLRLMQTFSAK
jgi:hypothetical protein